MPNPILKFNYDKDVSLITKSKSFKEAIIFILNLKEPASFMPIKMTEENSGKIYYFDETKFQSFIEGELLEEELLQECECEGLYRNMEDIEITEEETIDKGSLWKLKSNKFLLISSEIFLQIDFRNSNFMEI
jgi:predicted Ser/Thr protein kinase